MYIEGVHGLFNQGVDLVYNSCPVGEKAGVSHHSHSLVCFEPLLSVTLLGQV